MNMNNNLSIKIRRNIQENNTKCSDGRSKIHDAREGGGRREEGGRNEKSVDRATLKSPLGDFW